MKILNLIEKKIDFPFALLNRVQFKLKSIRCETFYVYIFDDDARRRKTKNLEEMLLDAETCSICLDIFDRWWHYHLLALSQKLVEGECAIRTRIRIERFHKMRH